MITRFKLFESKEDLPQIGEYVIVKPNDKRRMSVDRRDFLLSNVGRIVNKKYYSKKMKIFIRYLVEFKTGIDSEFNADEIIEHSRNREDIEYIENANKYNL